MVDDQDQIQPARAEPDGRGPAGARPTGRSRAGGCRGIIALNLRQVRKKGGRIHLTVPGEGGAAVRTLCNKLFAAGDYQEVDGEADCQLCRKRRDDPALVSSAFFEGDVGSQLLEMSLEQAQTARRNRNAGKSTGARRADTRRAAGGEESAGTGQGSRNRPEPRHQAEAAVERPSTIDDPEMANLSQVSDNVYRSPEGVLVRTRGKGPAREVAEVVFDGDAQVKGSPDGGVRIKLGDVIIEYNPTERRLRARYQPDSAQGRAG